MEGDRLRASVRARLERLRAEGHRRVDRDTAQELRRMLRGSGLFGVHRLEGREIDELLTLVGS
jgi:hypothetical protein